MSSSVNQHDQVDRVIREIQDLQHLPRLNPGAVSYIKIAATHLAFAKDKMPEVGHYPEPDRRVERGCDLDA